MFQFKRIIDGVKVFGKKNSPEILLVAGIGFGIATVVTACRATIKAQEVLEDTEIQIGQVHRAAKEAEKGTLDYSKDDEKKDTIIVYTKMSWRLVKTYAVPIALGAASVGCILTSHGIMRKRYLGMVAAYTAVDKAFKDYRKRVIAELGEDKDREYRGLIASEVIETKEGEDGEVITETKRYLDFDPNGMSPYSRIFYGSDAAEKFGGEGNPNFVTNYPEQNKYFLHQQQEYFNSLLQSRAHKDPKTGKRRGGWLFLSEVYKGLGFDPSQASQEVGWIYDEVNPIGDNYVDFGMYRDDIQTWNFINGKEDAILLDFNVDGYILDKAGLAKY